MLSDIQIARKYINKENSARNSGIKFTLSLTSFRNLMRAKKCYYTGVELTYGIGAGEKQSTDITVDRVDNQLGYVKGNVVACSHAANQLKSVWENPKNHLTVKQIKKMAGKL